MAEYYNVTTSQGDAEIAKAIAENTKLDITHIAFGDGNGSVPIPNKKRTTLVREVHRQAVTKYERHATNANWIVIETVIPSNVGGFTVREIGIIANNKLISHGSHAPFEKVKDPTGVSEYRLRFVQDISDASVVSITLDQSLIFATQAWAEENFIKRNEIVDNLTTNDSKKPVSAKQAKVLQDSKIDINDIVDNLTTNDSKKPVSAKQAKVLQDTKINKSEIGSNPNQIPSMGNFGLLDRGYGFISRSIPSNSDLASQSYVTGWYSLAGTYDNAPVTTTITGQMLVSVRHYGAGAALIFLVWNGIGADFWVGACTYSNNEDKTVTPSGVINWKKVAYTDSNVASASKLQTVRQINGVAFDGTKDININGFFNGDLTTPMLTGSNTSEAKRSGVYFHGIYEGNKYGYPINYGNRLQIHGRNNAVNEIFFEWSGASLGRIFVRSKGDVNTHEWSNIGQLAFTTSNISGNSATASKLQTARLIGGVSFDGSANINLPGVNTAGNQNTSGNAATATKLATARKINNVAFDGTKDITLPSATTGQSGTVQLNNTLTSVSTTQALTAAQGKILSDSLDILNYCPIAYPKNIPPNGYLVMMGQSISQSTYPKLFALYGDKLPDMRAYTIRGLDNGRGIDADRKILSEQEDAIRNITGQVTAISETFSSNGEGKGAFLKTAQTPPGSSTPKDTDWSNTGTLDFDASLVVPTARENRVKNIAFLYIVKAG